MIRVVVDLYDHVRPLKPSQLLSNHSYIVRIHDTGLGPGESINIKNQTGCQTILAYDEIPNRYRSDTIVPPGSRLQRINAALPHYDFIELDAEFDLTNEILDLVPPHMRLITWRNDQPTTACESPRFNLANAGNTVSENFDTFTATLRRIMKVDAFLYRIFSSSGVSALKSVHAIRQDEINTERLVVYAAGEQQVWSRIAATLIGSKFVFADSLTNGYASLASMVRQFGLPDLPAVAHLYGIAGKSVTQSISPEVHNAAFRALNYPGLYLAFPATDVESLQEIIDSFGLLGMSIRGLTTTSPLKDVVSQRFAADRDIVSKAQSANFLRYRQAEWRSGTTDDTGLLRILRKYDISVRNKPVSVLGSGGSGRIAAQALIELGAHVSLYNRSSWRARLASKLLNIECHPLIDFSPEESEIIVNTVPIAGSSHTDLPFSVRPMKRGCIVIDYNFHRSPNALTKEANRQGATVIDGIEMLQMQLLAQFNSLSDREIPDKVLTGILRQYRTEYVDERHTVRKLKPQVQLSAFPRNKRENKTATRDTATTALLMPEPSAGPGGGQ